jgi:hypothetical protein
VLRARFVSVMIINQAKSSRSFLWKEIMFTVCLYLMWAEPSLQITSTCTMCQEEYLFLKTFDKVSIQFIIICHRN